MSEIKRFLQDHKVNLLIQYDNALASNLTFLAKSIRIKLTFLDELLREVAK